MTKYSGFKATLNRLARDTQFKTFNDVLKNGMIAEYKRKWKNYPAYLRKLSYRWKKYTQNQVAKFIKDHYRLIFFEWFEKMFYFDVSRLEIKEPDTRSDVDFNAKLSFLYTNEEIRFIEELIEKYDIQYAKPLQVMNQLLLTGLRLLGPIIERYFQRPYDFQPEGLEDEDIKEGKLITIFFSSREA